MIYLSMINLEKYEELKDSVTLQRTPEGFRIGWPQYDVDTGERLDDRFEDFNLEIYQQNIISLQAKVETIQSFIDDCNALPPN